MQLLANGDADFGVTCGALGLFSQPYSELVKLSTTEDGGIAFCITG